MSAHPAGHAGVLLDLDGVLIDSSPGILELWHDLARRHGRELTPEQFADEIIGCSPDHTIDSLFGDLPAATRSALLREVREREPDLPFVTLPGARTFIDAAAAAGLRVAVVTGAGSDRALRALRTLGVQDAVYATVTWGETAAGKPAPDPYLLAARRVGADPRFCVAVEDAVSGVAAAVAASATCIGVGDPALLRHGAVSVVQTLDDLRVVRTATGARIVWPPAGPVPAGGSSR